jgi:hypothetical protein
MHLMKAQWARRAVMLCARITLITSGAVLIGGAAPSCAGGSKARIQFEELRIEVTGSVHAAIVDKKGRRTGWYDGRIEDIPECKLEASDDDAAPPDEYAFVFGKSTGGAYRLLIKPRTESDVEISVAGTLSNGRHCLAHAAIEVFRDEVEWQLRWSLVRDSCRTEIVPITRPKSGS